MAYSLLVHAGAGCVSGDQVATTSAIDTTGADFIAIVVSIFGDINASLPTDSKSNTWVAAEILDGTGANSCAIFYCQNPTVGTGHTFTWNHGSSFPSIYVAAFSGVGTGSIVDQVNKAQATQPGSITPVQNNELIITGFSTNGGGVTPTVSSPFTVTDAIAFLASGDNEGGGLAYQIQTSATAENPTWVSNPSPRSVIASFFTTVGDITIEVPAASLALTTYAPSADLTVITIEVPVAHLSLTKFAPVVFLNPLSIEIPTQGMVITTYAPVPTTTRAVEIPTGHLVITTYAPTVFIGDIGACSERFGPKLYYWEPSYLDRPEDTFLRATDWDNAGYQGMKFVQGIIIEADTEGQTREILLQGDQADIETLTINHNGQVMKPYSLNQPVQKHLLRLLPTDLTAHWRLFNIRWVFEPAPEFAKEWKTQGTDHDIQGYQFLKDGYIAHNSTADITLNILVDDQLFTYTIPNSGGQYVKTYILFSILNSGRALKGSLFTYELTSTQPFQLFQKDSEVRVHAWAGGGYQVKLPFGDISRKAGARI